MRSQRAVQQKHDQCGRQRRQREQHQHGVDQHHPHKQGQLAQCHAGRPHAQDRGHQIDAGRHAAHATDQEAQNPIVGARAARKRVLRQWSVAEPTHVGRPAGEETEIRQPAAEQHQPVAQSVDPWIGHVACADHQRHNVIGDPEQKRHRGEEDHRRAVHREELIERAGPDDVGPRACQLPAHQQGLDAARRQKHQAGADVQEPDPLVIDRGHPIVERGRRLAAGRGRGVQRRAHGG